MDKIYKAVTLKKVAVALFCIFQLSLLPIIINGFYAQPQVDDFSFGQPIHEALEEGKSPLNVINVAIKTTVRMYNNWQGNFSASLLNSFQPAALSPSLYFLTTIFMLIMIILPTFLLLRTLFVKMCRVDWRYVLIVGVPLLFLCTQYMVSVVEGLFWYVGAVVYVGFYGLMLLFVNAVLRLYILPTL